MQRKRSSSSQQPFADSSPNLRTLRTRSSQCARESQVEICCPITFKRRSTMMKIYRLEQPHGEFIEAVVPDPIAKPGAVLVRIHASGVNPLDTKIRAGQAAHAKHP